MKKIFILSANGKEQDFTRNYFINSCCQTIFRITIIACFIFSFAMTSCKPKTTTPPQKPIPTELSKLSISFQQKGGPFLIIGTNDDGVWAPHKDQGYWWNQMDVTIENKCEKAVYIDPVNFHLYVSSKPATENLQYFSATTLGKDHQQNPLSAAWLQPGARISGTLIFEVPEKLPDGTLSNGAYKMIRLANDGVDGSCAATYSPY